MPLEILRHVSFHELEWKRKKHGEKFRWSTLNAIREMIVNGIVMQRAQPLFHFRPLSRSSDLPRFDSNSKPWKAKSDLRKWFVSSSLSLKSRHVSRSCFHSGHGKKPHRSSKPSLLHLSLHLSGQRERETFATRTEIKSFAAVKEEEVSIHRVRKEEERKGEEGRKKGSTGAINLRNASLPLDLSRSNISPS